MSSRAALIRPSGQRYTIATETTPVPNATVGSDVLQEYYDHWYNVTESVIGVTDVIGSIAFQPVPKAFTEKAKARGGVSSHTTHYSLKVHTS